MAIATFGRYKRKTPHNNAGFFSSLNPRRSVDFVQNSREQSNSD